MSPVEQIMKNLSPLDTSEGIEYEDGTILNYSSDEKSSVSTNVSDDPTLIFENMNFHRSPLETIIEESKDNVETSLLCSDIELSSMCSFYEYDLTSDESIVYNLLIDENVCEDTKHDDKLFTELLLNSSIGSIENYCSELRYQYQEISEPRRSATSRQTCINELDEHERSATPGDSGFETDQEMSNDQYSDTSEESSCDAPRIYMDANEPLVINQCLEVFKQLSLAGIVNRNRQ